MTALHLAVTRVIEDEIVPADSATSGACERAAAAAIRVCMVEALRGRRMIYAYAIVAVITWIVASRRIQHWWEHEFSQTPAKTMRPTSLLFGLVAAFLWPLYAFWLVLVAIGWAWERAAN